MRRRQPLPRLWLMTDERQGEALWPALVRLPHGAGVIFRHYSLGTGERRVTLERVKAVARRRRLVLLLAGSPQLARAWGADGSHGHQASGARVPGFLRTAPAHNVRELRSAERSGAHLVFVSPVFVTRSHVGRAPLGRVRFALLARQSRLPVIALGGIDPARARGLRLLNIHGWAAIDAWSAV